jgi:hypothetical protein
MKYGFRQRSEKLSQGLSAFPVFLGRLEHLGGGVGIPSEKRCAAVRFREASARCG